MDQTVILRTGEETLTPLVTAAMSSLKSLMERQPIALYELVMLARDPQHKLFGNSGSILRQLNLIEADGRIHDSMRTIILAATEGDGLDLKLVSPLGEKLKGDK